MPIPVLSALILIFVVWLQYEIRRNNKNTRNKNKVFWENENNSNLSRRKDISGLNYIHVPLELLPMEDHIDDTINSYRDTICKLSDKKILNLTGLTNTEIKYQYGAANLNLLSEYDNNYLVLVSILHKWAERLYSNGDSTDAQAVLEFAVTCLSDVTKTYKLLTKIYITNNTPDKINHLVEAIQNTSIATKDRLISEIATITKPN